MTVSANLHVRDIDVDRIFTVHVGREGRDTHATYIGELSILGPLDQMVAVIGRAHEQLLAIQADRQAAPARAVLGSDDSLRIETAEGHGIGWLDVGSSQGFKVGDELLIHRQLDGGWGFVRWVRDGDDDWAVGDDHHVVPVTAPEASDG